MSAKTVMASQDFACSPEAVWQVLTDPFQFELWYRAVEGFAEDLGMSLGAKLSFHDQATTSVVTVLEPNRRMEISGGSFCDHFQITENDAGCTVSLQRRDPDEKQADRASEVLLQLHQTVFSGEDQKTQRPAVSRRRRVSSVNDIIFGVLQGYRTPLGTQRGAIEDSEQVSGIIGASEGDEAISLRGYLVAILCAVILFATLAQCFRFERSDIVPSSGMSVRESDDVNKEMIALIEIGTPQNTLERLINCRGQRLSNTEFYYCSVSHTPDGRRSYEAYITYDAYGHVRQILFLDNTYLSLPLSMRYFDENKYLLPGMSLAQIEEALNYPLSAFVVDKSGEIEIYFGRIFDLSRGKRTSYSAELVVALNRGEHTIDAQFYHAVNPSNPLYVTDINSDLRYQYRNYDEYIADLEAFERAFLLLGRERTEADAVFGTEGVDYRATYDGGIICSYLVKNRVSEETFYRYLYTATIAYDDIVQKMEFENRLLQVRYDTISDPGAYSISEGMSLYQVYDEIKLLPTYMALTATELTICYGAVDTESEALTNRYQIVLVFGADTHLLKSYQVTE